MSVSTLMIFNGAATPSSVVNLSMAQIFDGCRGIFANLHFKSCKLAN
jgi:hypothetical protein